jgi:uncharacterized protein YndB with AHSA1/START domain
MKELTVKKTVVIDAELPKVWDALVNPEKTKKYMFGTKVASNWKVGAPIEWKAEGENVVVKGSIEKIEVGRLLQYTTFDPNSKYVDVPSNYVHVTCMLTPRLGRTILSVTQGDFSKVEDGQKRFSETSGGWDQALTNLKSLVENK